MKKITLFLCLMAALFLSFNITPSHAAEVDVLINKLVEKGILTREEATLLLKDMQKEGARQETVVKETAEKVAKKTAEKTVKKEAASGKWASVPKWVNRIHFKGNFRLRYQYQSKYFKYDAGDQDRGRGRYRWRFGAVADVTKDKKWKVGFGLSSGSGDPRSTNQTFTNSFEKFGVRIDYAYAQYKPVDWIKAVAGQIKNPLYRAKDLQWDSDITPQGIAVPVKYWWNKDGYFFVTPSLFVLNEFKSQDMDDPWMFVIQGGAGANIGSMWAKGGISCYQNSKIKGNILKYSSESNSRNADGEYIYNYSGLTLDGEYGFKFDSYIQLLRLFGQFVSSDADNDNKGWLVGFNFGRKVKKFADWQLKYNYRYLEKDSVLDVLPDSDFYGGKTNAKGHEIAFNFGLAKKVIFSIDYYHTQKIDYAPDKTDEPEDVLQVDFYFKF
jgi:polyhydroxyalkanoate synthesis regulator phasin